ncbi:trypsin I-P1-like isoform X1 [Cebidichthys violaceus]|uniref:trypsin I-P1-like isoform X1 n=1 Tax=Cebidichthys violaceus TaxID=271503 RepID=UPI0035CBDCD5
MGGMTRLLLLLLWAGVTVGRVVDLQKRIIGGRDCTNTERGYHVFLKINGEPFCSGSLISKDWILTAAHCWEPEENIKAVFGRDPNSKNEVAISDHKIFEDKDAQGKNRSHDIMLLKLTKPATIKHVPLPDCKHQPKKDDEVQIAGYKSSALPGHYNDDSLIDFSKPLQCAKSKVVDCGVFCPPKNSTYVYPHLLCFQDATVDISSGDSGGGLVYHGMIYGVNVLSANATCRGSAKSMDVCEKSYLTWIKTTAGIP